MLSCAFLAVMAATGFASPQSHDDVIVVTASRTEEMRGNSTVPVGVLGGDELDRLGAQHISEALNRIPGVYLNRGNGVEHLTSIRSAVLTGGAGAGSFLYLQDGVPLRAPGFANINGLMEANDALAGQIEVVRGPGGPAYGTNALHGLVNVLSPDPLTAGIGVLFEVGSFGRSRIEAYASGETYLGQGYLGGAIRNEDGWRDDASLFRLGLLARLDRQLGQTEISLRASLIDIDQETATFVQGFEAYRDEALSRTNTDPEAFRNVRAARLSVHTKHEFTETIRLELVGYGRSNEMDFRLHFLPSEALERTGHDSLGLQSALIFENSTSRFSIGLDGDLTTGFLYEFQDRSTVGPFVQGLHYDYTVDSLVLAGFAQARHAVTPSLTIEGGLRLETTEYEYENRAPDGVLGRYLRPADRIDDFGTFAPSFGLTWQALEEVQIFARAARGVRAPQASELYRLQPGQEIEGIEPEELDSLEAGFRLARGPARLELIGFTMQKRNVFFRDADGLNVTDGQTRHKGVEVEARWQLDNSLALSTSLSWAVHEYAFDRVVSRGSEVILDGARLDTAPEWLANTRLIWTPTDRWETELEWVHVGEYFADAGNTAAYDGHDLFNLRARYQLTDTWSAFASVRNLTDERFAERADFAFGSYRYFPGEPRSLSLGLSVRR